jgi:hypothetical protein
MQARILSLICVLVFLASCRDGNESGVSLFNGFKFATNSTEHVADRDSLAQVPYTKYFNNMAQVQIPLYRVIEGKEYRIYLGIPFHTTLGKLAKSRAEQPMADTVWNLKESGSSFYRQFIKDSLYLTEYICPLDSTSIICVYAETRDAELAATILSEEQLKARIIK